MEGRPGLSQAKRAFTEVNKSVSDVGTFIGGKVNYNVNVVPVGKGRFENVCAIRMSYVLNKTGIKIPFIPPNETVSGKNGNWYIFKVKTLIKFLKKTLGEPDHVFNLPTAQKISKFKGILIFEVDQWNDATGHATIWDGASCSDKCYFTLSKKAYLWELKN